MTTKTPSITDLLAENALQRGKIARLEGQLAWLTRQLFGQRSEKFVDGLNENQLLLPGFELPQSEEEGKKKVAAHERRQPKRDGKDKITLPPDLPVERQMIDLPEEEKSCAETGEALVKIGEEVTRKLAHKPGSYFIKEIVRFKYALPKNSEGGIRTAPLPESLLIRCQADESFLADILTKKFADHLPLYRISEILGRDGIGISRQILCQWVVRCGQALKPLYEEMNRQVLLSGNVFIDESPLDMLAPGKGKTHQAYMWVMVGGLAANPAYRVYHFRTNRKHENALQLLQGYKGVLHSDSYGAYQKAAEKEMTWCPCYAHIRRKFIEAESGDPPFRNWVLRKIRYLYMLERVAWNRAEEERLRIRQEKEGPIIDELIEGIKQRLATGKILPKSKLREALGYFLGLIPHLKNYLKHPYARLDNNVAERAIRPLALGRKNWLFVGSEEGGEASAVVLSLVQTCRGLSINPREYLEDVMRRLMSHSANKLHELLPDHWHKSREKPSSAAH
jgi:transposase